MFDKVDRGGGKLYISLWYYVSEKHEICYFLPGGTLTFLFEKVRKWISKIYSEVTSQDVILDSELNFHINRELNIVFSFPLTIVATFLNYKDAE